MAVAPDFRSLAMQAILGPDHSGAVPANLWVGWLDGTGDLIAMSGTRVEHEAFGPSDDGVQNVVPLDCGIAGAGWVIHAVGLFAGPSGGDLFLSADLDAPVEPAEDDALAFGVGELEFTVGPGGIG